MEKSVFNTPLITAAKHEKSKPANGTTMNEPFAKGTAGSTSFRIPALLTLDSGRVVAAADARWDSNVDGGGFDTIVSYSDDNGKNWNYSFVNYLGDNGNKYDGKNSSCFIDPALATDGKKVWMLCDLYPYGVALNGNMDIEPQTNRTGFDSKGRLLLTNDINSYKPSQYDFHLNLQDLKVDTNLFFKNSPYKVQRTGYLYLVSSDDGCKTFSSPKLLPLKNDTEKAYLASPGRGLYTKNGTIIFPCYKYNGDAEYTSFIYSTDNGITWRRSENAPTTTSSSESAVIELPNGNLRFFYRHHSNVKLKYIDAEFSQDTLSYNWKNEVETDITINSNTQISAIMYSSPINNKATFFLTCPTGPNEQGSISSTGEPYSKGGQRLNGKIFTGFLNDDNDNTVEWLPSPMRIGEYNSEFIYSCLTELKKDGNGKKNGDIALLYENHQSGWGSGPDKYFTMTYKTYHLSDIVPD